MAKKVQITVMKTACYQDLIEKYIAAGFVICWQWMKRM